MLFVSFGGHLDRFYYFVFPDIDLIGIQIAISNASLNFMIISMSFIQFRVSRLYLIFFIYFFIFFFFIISLFSSRFLFRPNTYTLALLPFFSLLIFVMPAFLLSITSTFTPFFISLFFFAFLFLFIFPLTFVSIFIFTFTIFPCLFIFVSIVI